MAEIAGEKLVSLKKVKISNFVAAVISPDHCNVSIMVSAYCVKCISTYMSLIFLKRLTGKQKAFCVFEFDINNSCTCVQSKFRTEFSMQLPADRSTI